MAEFDNLVPEIKLHHKSIPSPLPSSPSFVFQLTRLKDTLLIWAGTGAPTATTTSDKNTSKTDEGEEVVVELGERRLASEWGVAMPSRGVGSPSKRNETRARSQTK
jgi:proteasome assembly chaperone 4